LMHYPITRGIRGLVGKPKLNKYNNSIKVFACDEHHHNAAPQFNFFTKKKSL